MLHLCFIISPLRLLGVIIIWGALKDMSSTGAPGIKGSFWGGRSGGVVRVYTRNKSG